MGRGKLKEGQGVRLLINAPHFCLILNLGLKSLFSSTCFCFLRSVRAQSWAASTPVVGAEFPFGGQTTVKCVK